MSTTDRPGHASLRRGRITEPGRLYVVTTTTLGRTPHFTDHARATAVARQFVANRCVAPSWLWCWVLMPDHWHGLVELDEVDTLAGVMRRMKANTSRAANGAGERIGRIWSRAYHDRAIRSDESIIGAARYIVANPKRAGLVARVGDYPYWDAAWLKP